MFLAKKLNKGAGSPVALDAQFNYVTMLLHGDGTNGAQNNTFLDSSTNNFTITRNGNTTQGSFSPYGSNWSNYLSGYLTTANTSAFKVGTGDFTVEFWAYWIDQGTGSYYAVTSMGSNSLNIQNQFGTFNVQFEGISNTINFSLTPYYNSWNHFAVVRQSGTTKVYVNGSVVATASDTNDYQGSGPLNIGFRTGGGYTNSYFSNLRVCKSAVYTSTFTPSTAPLTTTSQGASNCTMLMCQSNRFIDNSTSALVFTVGAGTPSVQRFNPFGASTAYSTSVIGGSGYFDGSGDYLTASSTTAFDIASGTNFTFSCWVYFTSNPNNGTVKYIFDQTSTSGSGSVIFLAQETNNAWTACSMANAYSSSDFVAGQWYWITISRVSGTLRSFKNGTLITSGANTDASDTNRFTIAARYSDNYILNSAYLTDVRFVVGSGVTSDTVPTAPPTAITNTALLCNMTNGAIYDNAMMNDLETVGNAQISTSVVKYGTGSLAFDGTGDWLTCPLGANLTIGASSDFTIECWFRANNFSTNVGCIYSSSNGNDYLAIRNSANLEWANGIIQLNYTIPSASTTTWYHLAVTRSGSTVRMFLNGSVVATGTDTSLILGLGSTFYIGNYAGNTSAGYSYNGYIDDFRITKGYARYTANFTPPTAAFPNTGPV